jgi:hypothetical protein
MTEIRSIGDYGTYSTSGNDSEFELPGLGKVPISGEERTSAELVARYKDLLGQLEELSKKKNPDENDVKKMQELINALGKLAKEGDTSTNPPSYMPKYMLQDLKYMLGLAQTCGFTYGGATATLEGLQSLLNYKETVVDKDGKTRTITFEFYVRCGLDISGADKSLQEMLYTDFVKGAGQVFEKKLAALEEALKTNKDVASLLARLQELRNKFVSNPNTPTWGDSPNPSPTKPVLKDLTPEIIDEIIKLKKELKALLDKFPPPIGPDGKPLPYPDNSLPASLKKVYDDLAVFDNLENIDYKTNYPNGSGWLTAREMGAKWFMDGYYGDGKERGNRGDNITKAISATESLNDEQKEELRSTLYIYEEHMKMSTSLMQTLTKLIEKLASNISRG